MSKTLSIKHTLADFLGVLLFYGFSILTTVVTGKESLLRNVGILLFVLLLARDIWFKISNPKFEYKNGVIFFTAGFFYGSTSKIEINKIDKVVFEKREVVGLWNLKKIFTFIFELKNGVKKEFFPGRNQNTSEKVKQILLSIDIIEAEESTNKNGITSLSV